MSTSTWVTVMPILGILYYLVPIVLTTFIIVKFYKLFKEKTKFLEKYQ